MLTLQHNSDKVKKTLNERQVINMTAWRSGIAKATSLVVILIIALHLLAPAASATEIIKLTETEKRYYTKSINWGLSFPAVHGKPSGTVPFYGFSLKKFDAMYVRHPKKKEIYLTFDCGYDNGLTGKILDTLKKKKVKAIFFITKSYLEEKPGMVKRMKREGHLVGSHTMTHPYLSKCSVKKIRSELKGLAKLMKQKTGYRIDKYLRPPYGNYSIRSLLVTKNLGYKTVFWSLAWYDWDPNDQPSVDTVVNKFKQRYHKGMIPLMHIVSKADTEALPKIIDYMRSLKYKFKTFDS